MSNNLTVFDAEQEGIAVLKHVLNQRDLDVSVEPTSVQSSYDALVGGRIAFEIKGRNARHDEYKSWFLERNKLDAIRKVISEDGPRCIFYFCYFRKSNVAMAWKLDERIDQFETCRRKVRAKTASDVSTAYCERRDFILLPASEATKFTFDRSLLK